jgi:hypothetical protein
LLEECTVEFMNANGIAACGDHGIVRRCVARHNGQSGLDCGSGTGNLFEDVATLYNNRKMFSIDWGGAGNKLCQTRGNTVRGLVSAFNYGSGLWHDIDCRNTVVEDCLAIGNASERRILLDLPRGSSAKRLSPTTGEGRILWVRFRPLGCRQDGRGG